MVVDLGQLLFLGSRIRVLVVQGIYIYMIPIFKLALSKGFGNEAPIYSLQGLHEGT